MLAFQKAVFNFRDVQKCSAVPRAGLPGPAASHEDILEARCCSRISLYPFYVRRLVSVLHFPSDLDVCTYTGLLVLQQKLGGVSYL